MNNSKLFQKIGNLLIILSLIGTGILIYPLVIDEYRFRTQPEPALQTQEEFALRIPSLKLVSPVIKNVDPWNQPAYQEALQNGIAHAQGSHTPDKSGTVFLFAHSSDNIWNLTRTNTHFYRLGRIKAGERINLTYQNKDYTYQVSEIKKVWPQQVEYLTDTEKDQLILQTCYPTGTDLMRLLVIAERV